MYQLVQYTVAGVCLVQQALHPSEFSNIIKIVDEYKDEEWLDDFLVGSTIGGKPGEFFELYRFGEIFARIHLETKQISKFQWEIVYWDFYRDINKS